MGRLQVTCACKSRFQVTTFTYSIFLMLYRHLIATDDFDNYVSAFICDKADVYTSSDRRRTRMSWMHHHFAASLRPEIIVFAHLKKGRIMLCLCEAATGISLEMRRKALRVSISTGIGHARKHKLLASKSGLFVRALQTEHQLPLCNARPFARNTRPHALRLFF